MLPPALPGRWKNNRMAGEKEKRLDVLFGRKHFSYKKPRQSRNYGRQCLCKREKAINRSLTPILANIDLHKPANRTSAGED